MNTFLQVPHVFFVVIFLLTILASIFFTISPINEIKKYKTSVQYYNLFYICMGAGYLFLLLGLSPLVSIIKNCLFILSCYSIKYGLLWRNEGVQKHLYKDKVMLINMVAVALFTIILEHLVEVPSLYRAFVFNTNMALILLHSTTYISKLKSTLSKGELVMKTVLVFSASLITMTSFTYLVTNDILVVSTIVFIELSLFTFITFGALLTLLLSDIISFHYKNSVTDPMTGLYNRRYFVEQAKSILESSQRHNYQISIIMCDIDKFKQINDTYGHDAGDEVIITFGAILKDCARGSDVVSRFGGEEFMILLPQTTLIGATEVAERIRKRTEYCPVKHKNTHITFTSSFGVTTFDKSTNIDDQIKVADEALYEAKESGRNRVCTR